MPSKHSPLKRLFTVQIPQDLFRKLEKVAEQRGIPVGTLIVVELSAKLMSVSLTEEDYRIIGERILSASKTIGRQ